MRSVRWWLAAAAVEWERVLYRWRERRALPAVHALTVEAANESHRRCRALEAERDALRERVRELEIYLAGDLELNGPPALTAAEIERLALLAEECGEVAQAVGKILRHGWESQSPFRGLRNRVGLERELGHVRAAMELMHAAGDVHMGKICSWREKKKATVGRWLHHQTPGDAKAEGNGDGVEA